jgi:MFS family permease
LKQKVYTTQFWLLCCSTLLFFASFNMVIPVLPAYLTQLGGGQYKGLIIALFTVTALLSRPFSGKLADKIGRVPVIMVGAVVCIVCSALYPLMSSFTALLWLRLLHGFSTGFTPTGETAYIADIIPPERRGEGMGIIGTANTVGMAGGMALGGLLGHAYGFNVVFYTSASLAFLSIVILFNTKETLKTKQKLQLSHFRLKRSDLFEPRVIAPCIVMLLAAYAYGSVVTLIPDYSLVFNVKNTGILLTYFTMASLAVRLIGGKASDKFGRKSVLYVSVTAIAVAMFLLASAETRLQAILGVILYGFAQGATSPTLLAWATDLSDPAFKGKGVASLYISMELGIGLGAFFSGLLYGNRDGNFPLTFFVAAGLAIVGLIFLGTERLSKRVGSVSLGKTLPDEN